MSPRSTKDDAGTPMLDFIEEHAAGDAHADDTAEADPMADLLAQPRLAAEPPRADVGSDTGKLPAEPDNVPREAESGTDAAEAPEEGAVQPTELPGHAPEATATKTEAETEAEAEKASSAPRADLDQGPQPEAESPLQARILLREHVLDIAEALEKGDIGRRTAGRRLREVCEDDARGLDADDIEIDFDAAPEDRGGLAFLAELGTPRSPSVPKDPIEAALLDAIRQRDRGAALRIIGDTPGAPDRAAYTKSLIALRDALNAHLAE